MKRQTLSRRIFLFLSAVTGAVAARATGQTDGAKNAQAGMWSATRTLLKSCTCNFGEEKKIMKIVI